MFGKFTGAAYPLGNSVSSTLGGKPDVNVIVSSIRNILTTPKGTVPYNPEIGSLIPSLVFGQNDATLHALMAYYAKTDIERQEPRCRVKSATAFSATPNNLTLQVIIELVGQPTSATTPVIVEYTI
jgi:phage baseplate assembly protein W